MPDSRPEPPPGTASRLTSWQVAVLAAVLATAVAGGRWATGGFDLSRFVVASARFVDPERVPVGLTLQPDREYDGMFYLRLALDPLTRAQEEHGIAFDAPAWRQQRILYPALAYLVALGGQPRLVLAALVLVNVAALTGLALGFAHLAVGAGRAPVWGLLPVLYASSVMPLARDLAGPVAACLVAAALVACQRGRHGWCAIALTAAVLTRETAALGVMGLAAAGAIVRIRGGRPGRAAWLSPLAPLVALAVWDATLRHTWGTWPWASGGSAFGWPLAGLVETVLDGLVDRPQLVRNLVSLPYIVWLVALVVEVGRSLRGGAAGSLVLTWSRLAVAGWLALTLLISQEHWHTSWNFVRILSDLGVYALAAVLLVGVAPSRRFTALTLAVFAGTVVRVWVRT